MQELLEKSIILATKKHSGQTDKGGQPYILHPLRVMNDCNTIETKIVAVLHDILEDTDTTTKDLLEFLPEYLINSIVILTRNKNESYEDYIKRISKNYYATQVKLMDLEDNMNLDRLEHIEMRDMKRYLKYRKAKEYLEMKELYKNYSNPGVYEVNWSEKLEDREMQELLELLDEED